ncbi:MAG: DNA polymerase I [Actinomycetota bacterium]
MAPSSKANPARILLLDGHSLAFRAFFALLEADLRTTSGQATNAVYGFTSMLIKALQEHKTRYLVVVFDRGRPVERLEIRPEYKAQRTTPPDEFTQQMGLIREVLKVLRVPVVEVDNTEADDLIGVLAERFGARGHDVTIVTADRDFFQSVGPRIKVLMNRRGISDTVLYDEAAVRQRYGFGPERYLDYAALRGDPSDNIPGVPGVGEKTAARLVQTHATLEEVFEHLDELPGRAREALRPQRERLLENRDFFRLRTPDELEALGVPVGQLPDSLEELRMGEWDLAEIRRLFDALEFRTLFDRASEMVDAPPPAEGGFEVSTREASSPEELDDLVAELVGGPAVTLAYVGDRRHPREAPDALGFALPGSSWVVPVGDDRVAAAAAALGPVLERAKLVTHGSKDALLRLEAIGLRPEGVAMDTEVAAYLIDPARGSYPLDELTRRYLSRELRLEQREVPEGQGMLPLEAAPEEPERTLGIEAAAIGELAPVLEKELRERGAWDLFVDLELPLAGVLATMERAGVRIDVDYLAAMASALDGELANLEASIYDLAGEPFNINSPPQLRKVLYERLGLKPSKRTKTGFSTDASVLESLRDQHPVVDTILRYRERAKLKSTYIDALPRLVDSRTGRLHCRFNQTVASTGRLSSDSPNLQNIPIRTEEGRQIRRAFIPEDGYLLLVADYSQIELRVLAHLSGDGELMAAFERGEDIHRRSIAKALGIPEEQVTSELRGIGKMVSYGVTYGMGPFGLAQRLHIPIDQARTYINGFFELYPRVREYLDLVVARAAEEGFTTTLLGRRRYLPELQARNPRVRSLGERMALNAPIQGSAADILKLAMVRVASALLGTLARMVLTVHDELVFEVPEGEVADHAEVIRAQMEGAVELRVPLEVDLAWGPNWAEAKG